MIHHSQRAFPPETDACFALQRARRSAGRAGGAASKASDIRQTSVRDEHVGMGTEAKAIEPLSKSVAVAARARAVRGMAVSFERFQQRFCLWVATLAARVQRNVMKNPNRAATGAGPPANAISRP